MFTSDLLTRAAEELSMVVDSTARARLQGEYLGLLKEWESARGHPGGTFARRAQELYTRVRMGRGNYRLWPGLGLGPLDGRFWTAYQNAAAVLMRLESLAGRSSDPAVRAMRLREVRDLCEQTEKIREEVERVATSTQNLSRMETAASTLNNMLAVHLLSRERQWSGEMRRTVPSYAPRGVTSGAVSMITRPDLWQTRIAGLAGWYQDYGAAVSGAWKARREQVIKSSRAGWAKWQSCVKRLAAVKARLEKARRNPRKAEAAANLDSRRSALVALARNIAADLKSVVGWTDPMKFWETHLAAPGEAERSAGILLQTEDVEALAKGTAELERSAAALGV